MIQARSPWLSHLWGTLNGIPIVNHFFCQYRSNYVSVQAEVRLGSIIYWPSGSRIEHAIEIASATGVLNEWSGWHGVATEQWREDDGAVRYNSRDVFNRTLWLINCISAAPWLAQANFKIGSNHEDYNLVNGVEFTLKIGKMTQNPPDGYLFLSLPKDFKTGPMSVRWPDLPAYWSLDPSRGNPLSDEEASSLGFPSITQTTEVYFKSWDETIYAGLRKFDKCKGFDPESQDVAKKLGFPLCVIGVPARELDWTLDEDNERDYTSVYSEEEYTMDDEMGGDLDLPSSYVEVLTTDDENFLEEFSSDESDCSNSYPEDGVLEIESNQELTAENEDSLRNLPFHGTVVGQQDSVGELVEPVKFGLIVVLGLAALYEYAGVLF
ncbi:hypothetical protein MSAN_01105900 [Mycena sanguinolenta]|uniref:Uncharacterized protein n=1 Tax=Mycena sanguinolenta TaxID=230812 RepID=A0A8H6YQN3_9AGAR|nr:hypothetical protein MSAN_01105900 [Mycena sanguinolenta]